MGAKPTLTRLGRAKAAMPQDSLEDFFENGAIALHQVGGDGTILRANRAELELLGYAAEDYVGHHIAEFHADREIIDDILARLGRGETLRKYPARLRASDGSIKHVEITSSVQFRDGEFLNTRCFTVDVTERERALEEVKRKDELLRQVLDALPTALYTTDAGGRITYCNRAAAELAGREPEIGRDDWSVTFRLFTPDGEEIPVDQRPLTLTLKENRPVWGVEALARRPDGTFFPIMLFPTPLRDDAGSLIGAINLLVDITDRKQAEEMFRLAVEAAPSGMLLCDGEGRIVRVNGQVEKLLGYSRDELLDKPVEFLIPQRFRTGHPGFRRKFGRQPEVRAMGAGRDLFALHKDGTEVPVEIGLSPIETEQGLFVLSAIVDITERKRAAEREKMLAREVEHRSSNLLAVVQSIVGLSLAGNVSIEQAKGMLEERLASLARTHRHLTDASWRGLSLSEIAGAELATFSDQIEVEGCHVMLSPQHAQNFSLALHELATNAAKYGALSSPSGRVSIFWSVTEHGRDTRLKFQWREQGGPAVKPPQRQGFGTVLIKGAFSGVQLDFAPEGLKCGIELTLTEQSPTGQPIDETVGDPNGMEHVRRGPLGD
jgi:PAS domain S-box-containing protein